jgi:ribosomal protein S12 methylthiotransferase
MIDAVELDSDKITGRTQAHAPEVDGVVYIENPESQAGQPGELIDVKIIGATDYDLIGEKLHG